MIKRAFDISICLSGIILLAPLLFLTAVIIKITSKGPVFYRQSRVGQFGKHFRIHKFRTMVVEAEKIGSSITVGSDPRITPAGRFLRRFKIDELPQLINVIVGDMSIVGPRPEVPKYAAYYPNDIAEIVFSLRPGITDLASIKFKNESQILANLSDPEGTYIEQILPVKLKIYVDYVNHRSLAMDIKIVYQTILAIIT